jgi:formate transporter
MIVLLGLELVTGSFGLLPLPWLEQQVTPRTIIANWSWVFLGNLLGSVAYGALLAIALTNMGTLAPSGVAAKLVQLAEAKTDGKIAAIWLPIFTFFAQGFEHAVVNMFVIPTGMMLGAKVTVSDWWLWNQIPVTLGNLVGGFVFTGLALDVTHSPALPSIRPSTSGVPAE